MCSNVAPALANVDASYHCRRSTGALLSLEDDTALSTDLDNSSSLRQFQSHARQNYDAILDDIRRDFGESFPLEELVFVTGTTTTGDWEASTISSHGSGGDIRLSAGDTAVAQLTGGVWVAWSSQHQTRFKSSGHHHVEPTLQTPCCTPPKNQCIFIRKFRLKRRHKISKRINQLTQRLAGRSSSSQTSLPAPPALPPASPTLDKENEPPTGSQNVAVEQDSDKCNLNRMFTVTSAGDSDSSTDVDIYTFDPKFTDEVRLR